MNVNEFINFHCLQYLTENFASEDRAAEIADFFAKNSFPGTERTVQQSLETIRLNSEWLGRDSSDIKSYLSSAVSE